MVTGLYKKTIVSFKIIGGPTKMPLSMTFQNISHLSDLRIIKSTNSNKVLQKAKCLHLKNSQSGILWTNKVILI